MGKKRLDNSQPSLADFNKNLPGWGIRRGQKNLTQTIQSYRDELKTHHRCNLE